MVDEEFTISEVLDADITDAPKKVLLDRVHLSIRHFFRKHFSWPKLAQFERWEMLVLINEEFHKQLETHLLGVEAREEMKLLDEAVWN